MAAMDERKAAKRKGLCIMYDTNENEDAVAGGEVEEASGAEVDGGNSIGLEPLDELDKCTAANMRARAKTPKAMRLPLTLKKALARPRQLCSGRLYCSNSAN